MIVVNKQICPIFQQRMRLAEKGRHGTGVTREQIQNFLPALHPHRPRRHSQFGAPHRWVAQYPFPKIKCDSRQCVGLFGAWGIDLELVDARELALLRVFRVHGRPNPFRAYGTGVDLHGCGRIEIGQLGQSLLFEDGLALPAVQGNFELEIVHAAVAKAAGAVAA